MEQQIKHQELFRGEAKKLGYFLDQANEGNDKSHFFRALTQDIVPEIAGAKYCESFCLKSGDVLALYHEKVNKVAVELYGEIKRYFAYLRADIEAENLLNDVSLKVQVANLEQLLVRIGSDLPNADLRDAWKKFREICEHLIHLGRVDIVQGKYVEIRMIPEYIDEGQQGRWIDQPVIESLVFGDLIEELQDLREIFSWDNVREPWVAWYYLQLAAQCYNSPSKTDADDLKNIDSNKIYKMNLSNLSYEMSLIKDREENIYIVFFTVDRFKRYLTMVVSSILCSQRQAGVLIYSLKLDVSSNNVLFLIIKKHRDDDGYRRKIYKPNGESGFFKCFDKLLANPRLRVDVRDAGNSYSVSKIKGRIKIPDKLWRLFFTEIDGSVIMLNGNPIILENQIDIDHSALMEEIDRLKKMD